MRYISPANLSYLATSELTLCLCVKLTLRDGTVLGFTDLDADLTISAVVYRAKVGLAVGAMRWSNKLEDEKTELQGLFSDLTGGLTEANAKKGLYNEALVEIFLANWSSATLIVPLKRGTLCNFVPMGTGYTAEVRSLCYPLSKQIITRQVTFDCNAELGDSRCTKVVNSADGVISSWLSLTSFVATGFFAGSGLSAGSDIVGGKLVLTGSGIDWFTNKIKSYDSGTDTFTFWRPFPGPLADLGGWDFTAYEGCDKKPGTCKDRFNNIENYRGFQFTPDRDETAIAKGPTIENGGYVAGVGEDD